MTVPVVDFESVSIEKEISAIPHDALKSVGKEMVRAFSEVGFLQITNHGIKQELVDSVMRIGEAYFELPLTAKETSLRGHMELLGYLPTPENVKQHGKTDMIEHMSKDIPPDPKETLHYAEFIEKERNPDQHLPGFSKIINQWLTLQHALHRRMMLLLGYGLGLNQPEIFVNALSKVGTPENETVLRFASYPPLPDAKSGDLRCGEHTDFGTLTFVFQNSIRGLEVCDRNGVFQPVIPVAGGAVVNIGDILELWTGGVLRAAPHRVVVDEETKTHRRLSAIYFGITDADYPISAAIGVKTGKYQGTVTAKTFLNRRYVDIYEKGKGLMDDENE